MKLSSLAGAKQLFWGDLHSESRHFQPLFHFLATDVVFVENRKRLDVLPQQSRAGILSTIATFLPFYDSIMVRLMYRDSLNAWPLASKPLRNQAALELLLLHATAAWCISCLEHKQSRGETRSRLQAAKASECGLLILKLFRIKWNIFQYD